MLGTAAPTMLLTTISEIIVFVIAAQTPMVAVKYFALTAALVLFINLLLQVSKMMMMMMMHA